MNTIWFTIRHGLLLHLQPFYQAPGNRFWDTEKLCVSSSALVIIYFFLNFILIYKLNIQIQISLVIGNLYSADLITGISSITKMNE